MASGDELAILTRENCDPPAANAALWIERNTTKGIAFDDSATTHKMVFSWYVPAIYDGGNLVVKYIGAAATGTTGDVDLDTEIEFIGVAKDLDTDSFGTLVSSDNNNVPGTAGQPFVITATLTAGAQTDSAAAAGLARIRVTRDSADTLAGNYEIYRIVISEA